MLSTVLCSSQLLYLFHCIRGLHTTSVGRAVRCQHRLNGWCSSLWQSGGSYAKAEGL